MLGPWGMGQGSSWPRGSETVECWSHSETLGSSPAWSWTCRTLQRLQDITSRAKLRGCVSDAGVTRKMIHGKGEVLRTWEQWVIHLVMPCGHFHACGGQLNKLLCLLTFTTSIHKISQWQIFTVHFRIIVLWKLLFCWHEISTDSETDEVVIMLALSTMRTR